jgi:hypothetical protein
MQVGKKKVSVHDKLTLLCLYGVTIIRYRRQAAPVQVSVWEAPVWRWDPVLFQLTT